MGVDQHLINSSSWTWWMSNIQLIGRPHQYESRPASDQGILLIINMVDDQHWWSSSPIWESTNIESIGPPHQYGSWPTSNQFVLRTNMGVNQHPINSISSSTWWPTSDFSNPLDNSINEHMDTTTTWSPSSKKQFFLQDVRERLVCYTLLNDLNCVI